MVTGIIRKLSVGSDYKNGMVYTVGQSVIDRKATIHLIDINPLNEAYRVWIKNKNEEVTLYKEFGKTMPASIEYNVNQFMEDNPDEKP